MRDDDSSPPTVPALEFRGLFLGMQIPRAFCVVAIGRLTRYEPPPMASHANTPYSPPSANSTDDGVSRRCR